MYVALVLCGVGIGLLTRLAILSPLGKRAAALVGAAGTCMAGSGTLVALGHDEPLPGLIGPDDIVPPILAGMVLAALLVYLAGFVVSATRQSRGD